MKATNKSNQQKAYGYALLTVLFWSTVSSAFKITLRYISFDELLLWATLTGTFALLSINLMGKHRLKKSDFSKKSLCSSALMGFINPFLYYLVLIKAYSLLEAQEAASLNYVWPLFLVLFSIIFLGQKIKSIGIIAMIISFFGVFVIVSHGNFSSFHFSNSWGVVLALSSALLWASYWILNMKDQRNDVSKIGMNLLFGFVYIVLYQFIVHGGIAIPDIRGLLGSVYIGLFEMSITFVIWLKALTLSEDTAKVSNLIFLSPFLALFWISNTVGETIRLSTAGGMVLIVAGIILQQFTAWKR